MLGNSWERVRGRFGAQAVQRRRHACEGERAQIRAARAGAYEKESTRALEIAGTHSNHGLPDHVAQEVQPEAAAIVGGQRTHGGIAGEHAGDRRAVVEAAEERDVVERIAADGIVEIDERGDAVGRA